MTWLLLWRVIWRALPGFGARATEDDLFTAVFLFYFYKKDKWTQLTLFFKTLGHAVTRLPTYPFLFFYNFDWNVPVFNLSAKSILKIHKFYPWIAKNRSSHSFPAMLICKFTFLVGFHFKWSSWICSIPCNQLLSKSTHRQLDQQTGNKIAFVT